MPIYPALALLIGSALATGGRWIRIGSRVLMGITTALFVVLTVLLALVWRTPAVGDISRALVQTPGSYTLSMSHILDLTVGAFAYLKFPLGLAAVAFALASVALMTWRSKVRTLVLALAACMVLFIQAARIALEVFDPYLGSYPLAVALEHSPPGQLIGADAYYAFSSVYFYTNRSALLWNGRRANLEYGSYAPGAPQVFIDDAKFVELWNSPSRWYLLVYGSEMPHVERVVGHSKMYEVSQNGDNYLLTNQPLQ